MKKKEKGGVMQTLRNDYQNAVKKLGRVEKTMVIAVIASLYVALCLALSAISFGVVQFRISEALTILPVFTPLAIPALTLGCFISNLVGVAMGTNIAGALDVFVGTLATFIAAVMSYMLRKVRVKGLPIWSVVPPIVINAVFIGLELDLVLFAAGGSFSLISIPLVGLGQFVACGIGGIILFKGIDKVLKEAGKKSLGREAGRFFDIFER